MSNLDIRLEAKFDSIENLWDVEVVSDSRTYATGHGRTRDEAIDNAIQGARDEFEDWQRVIQYVDELDAERQGQAS